MNGKKRGCPEDRATPAERDSFESLIKSRCSIREAGERFGIGYQILRQKLSGFTYLYRQEIEQWTELLKSDSKSAA